MIVYFTEPMITVYVTQQLFNEHAQKACMITWPYVDKRT